MAEVVVVNGYAGSGKTTLCKQVTKEGLGDCTVRHISIGDRLRAIRTGMAESGFSDSIKSPDRASPLPDDIANGVVIESLEEGPDTDLVLIDGYPRYLRTVGLFYESLQEHDYRLLGTIFLSISLKTSTDRILARGIREGDDLKRGTLEEEVYRRYNRDAQTVRYAVRELGKLALLEHINADGDQDEVYQDFKSALGNLAFQHR